MAQEWSSGSRFFFFFSGSCLVLGAKKLKSAIVAMCALVLGYAAAASGGTLAACRLRALPLRSITRGPANLCGRWAFGGLPRFVARSVSGGFAAAPKRSWPSQHVCVKPTALLPMIGSAVAARKTAARLIRVLFSLVGLHASQTA